MLKRSLLPVLLGCALLVAAGALAHSGAAHAQALPGAAAVAHADPSSQQIYAVARAGNLAEARAMIEQVLRDYPANGKAHWVAAEVYARSGDFARARAELSTAQSLSPGLPFATAASVASLQQQLASGRAYGVPAHRGISWGGVVLLVGVAALIYALVRRRSAALARYGAPYGQPGVYPGPNNPYGPYPNVGPYGASGMPTMMGGGSGLMGNLATGLAVGAGVAAGEELVQHALGGGGGSLLPGAGAAPLSDAAVGAPNADMGGPDFGLTGNGSWDDGSGGGGDPGGGDLGGGDLGGGDLGGGGDWT
ncbi:MAG TPA: tetratricopeptide repeat protein [Steroidobacteraceae bacterium]|nr:tetratricopeptide repeat protein [Steroidobacteraceae bacterium]